MCWRCELGISARKDHPPKKSVLIKQLSKATGMHGERGFDRLPYDTLVELAPLVSKLKAQIKPKRKKKAK